MNQELFRLGERKMSMTVSKMTMSRSKKRRRQLNWEKMTVTSAWKLVI